MATSGQSGTYLYTACLTCESSSGDTATTQVVPFPIYSDLKKNAVAQTTAVELGGFHGLNS